MQPEIMQIFKFPNRLYCRKYNGIAQLYNYEKFSQRCGETESISI
jgi:hypothetical protein